MAFSGLLPSELLELRRIRTIFAGRFYHHHEGIPGPTGPVQPGLNTFAYLYSTSALEPSVGRLTTIVPSLNTSTTIRISLEDSQGTLHTQYFQTVSIGTILTLVSGVTSSQFYYTITGISYTSISVTYTVVPLTNVAYTPSDSEPFYIYFQVTSSSGSTGPTGFLPLFNGPSGPYYGTNYTIVPLNSNATLGTVANPFKSAYITLNSLHLVGDPVIGPSGTTTQDYVVSVNTATNNVQITNLSIGPSGSTITQQFDLTEARTGPTGPAAAGSGAPLLSGVGPPSGALGNLGDFYVDTLNQVMYGPKTNSYGVGSIDFGTSLTSYLHYPVDSIQLGSGAFTIETFLYFPSVVAGTVVFSLYNRTLPNKTLSVQLDGASSPPDGHPSYIRVFIDGEILIQPVAPPGNPGSLSAGTWNHLALVKDGTGQVRCYINGYSDTNIIIAANLNDSINRFTIGNFSSLNGSSFSGYMTNFRVVVGSAVYTSVFAPPTSPLTAIPGTQLLLLAEYPSSVYLDDSSSVLTATYSGTQYNVSSPFLAQPSPWPIAISGGGGGGIPGASGQTGVTGPRGPTGPSGQTGQTGLRGPTGSTGFTGETGPTGTRGPTGSPGVTGETGPSWSQGPTGPGVPAGGTAGYVLTKATSNDFDTVWSPSSGGGGNTIYNDAWIESNFIGPPPPIVFGTVTASSTNIYVPWTYPSQTPIGLITSWIPVINSITSSASYTVAGPTVNTIIPFSNSSNSYINYRNGSPFITGVVFSKQAGSSGIQSITFPGESNARYAYVYYNPALSNMIASSNNTFTAWYQNTNPNSNPSTVQLVLFVTSGPPSAPRSLTISPITSNTATVNYVAPLSNDITDPTTLLTISGYTVSYASTGSTIRYGGPVADPIHTVAVAGLSYAASSLYPDSLYSFAVSATNSDSKTGASNTTTATTSNLTPSPLLSGSLSFPARYYSNGTIRNIGTGLTKTALVNSTASWTSSPFIAPIHSVANRGSAAPAIMSLSVSSLNNATTTTGPTIPFNGFPATTPSSATASNLTLTPVSVYDPFTGTIQNTGFYLNSSNTLTLATGIFVASQFDYTITATESNAAVSSATFTFQYDTPVTTLPVITAISFVVNSNYSSWVSGVRVLAGTPVYTVRTVMSNMGNYYYSSPLLVYTAGPVAVSPSSETDLTRIVSGLTSGTFASSITCSNTGVVSASLASTYSALVTLSGVANNIFGSSSSVSATPFATLIDGPSVALVYTTLPQSLPSLTSGVARVGFRVTSAVAGAASVPPFDAGGTPYANTAYDNTADITSLQELQVANGSFTTKSAQVYAYSNYTSSYYDATNVNTANYSSVASSGYRYATFAWAITPASPAVYGTLTFTLNTTSTITVTNTLAYAGSSPLQLFYRTEDIASSAPTNGGSLSSAWINGNSTTGIQLTNGNYFLPATYTSTPNWGLTSVTVNGTTSTVFSVKIHPLNISSGTQIRLYCRVGLPMAENCRFATVTATLS